MQGLRVVLIMDKPQRGLETKVFSGNKILLIKYCPKVGKFKLRHRPPWGLSQGLIQTKIELARHKYYRHENYRYKYQRNK
jgi:hypothetical protein